MDEFAEYNAMPKYVVSSTLTDPEWNNTYGAALIDEVARLKEGEGGTILVHGSATLAQGLADAGLVDRYHLLVFPVCSARASACSSTARPDEAPPRRARGVLERDRQVVYDVVP